MVAIKKTEYEDLISKLNDTIASLRENAPRDLEPVTDSLDKIAKKLKSLIDGGPGPQRKKIDAKRENANVDEPPLGKIYADKSPDRIEGNGLSISCTKTPLKVIKGNFSKRTTVHLLGDLHDGEVVEFKEEGSNKSWNVKIERQKKMRSASGFQRRKERTGRGKTNKLATITSA